jgi:hypothetical protein
MAGKASGLKGVALIDSGSTNSTVAGTLHFFQDLTSGMRCLKLRDLARLFTTYDYFALAVSARMHRGEGEGHGPCSWPAWIPHPLLRRHHKRLQFHWCVSILGYYRCLVCNLNCCLLTSGTVRWHLF